MTSLSKLVRFSSDGINFTEAPPSPPQTLNRDSEDHSHDYSGTGGGEDVGIAIAKNKTIPKSEVEAAAFAAFDSHYLLVVALMHHYATSDLIGRFIKHAGCCT